MSFTPVQAKALSITPHFSGALSIIGSLSIIVHSLLVENPPDRLQKRLMIGLSTCDIIGTLGFFPSTWPIDSKYKEESDFHVFGNSTTCTIQGFFVQMSIAIPLYNVVLTAYSLLLVKFRLKEKDIKKFEPFMHAVPILFGLITSIVGLTLNLFHDATLWCWIAPDKNGVESSWKISRWTLYYGPLWASYVVVTIMIVILYTHVLNQEKKVEKFRSSVASTATRRRSLKERKQSRRLAHQSMLYVGVFYLVWIPATINRILNQVEKEVPFTIVFLHTLLAPCQGFLNAIVHNRHKLCSCFMNKSKELKTRSSLISQGENVSCVEENMKQETENGEVTPSVKKVVSYSECSNEEEEV